MTHAHDDSFGEFAQELRALAETLLERVEPALRRAAADGRAWDSCSWCPVCATAALVRGEHHDVVAAVADHGTAIVTVLREALAGVPVEPLLPDDLPDAGDASDESDSAATEVGADPSSERTEHDGWIAGGAAGDVSGGAESRGRGPETEVRGSGSGADRRAKGVRGDVGARGPERGGAEETASGAKPPADDRGSKARRGGRRAAERAGRGRDSVERPGYVPIPVRIKK
ncbi:hypothetical protein [Nocardia mikamii]|uniref:hypothetical protein n=1 Tax=Nocardia mikamii TaxID=508464 RepID=UPI0007A3A28B|nr:hypothetical protein [Nocardia mikamii]